MRDIAKLAWVLLLGVAACSASTEAEGEAEAEAESESEAEAEGEDLVSIDCGAVALDPDDGADLAVQAPDGPLSTMVALDGAGVDLIAFETITAPDGTVVYDYNEVPPYNGTRTDPNDILVTALLPVAPEVPPAAGAYAYHAICDGCEPLDLTATCVAKVGAEPDGVTLDVAHHFMQPGALSMATYGADANFQTILQRIADALTPAGVTLGAVTFDDIQNEALASIDSTDGPDSELAALFSQAPSGRTLHVYWVEQISGDEGFLTVGQAGGVPGPATVGGTGRSAVAVTTADLGGTADDVAFLGLTAAHEIIHFLGLFHTTEKCSEAEIACDPAEDPECDPDTMTVTCEPFGNDPVTDTPECDAASDADGDGYFSADECAGADSGNMMFWSPDSDASELTADQGYVLRHNPLTR